MVKINYTTVPYGMKTMQNNTVMSAVYHNVNPVTIIFVGTLSTLKTGMSYKNLFLSLAIVDLGLIFNNVIEVQCMLQDTFYLTSKCGL